MTAPAGQRHTVAAGVPPRGAPLVARGYALWARLGDDGAASFDACGRLLTFRHGARYYRRGLDNALVELERDAHGPYPWRARRVTDAARHIERIAGSLTGLERHARDEREVALLARAQAGLRDHYAADARAFGHAVGPVPIVPPNHARSVVVRLTEGCQYDACRFCTLYAGTRFRVRPPAEFRSHVRDVLEYFGEGAGVRPSLWVGDASALEATATGFAEALEIVRSEVRITAAGDGSEGHLFKGDDPRRFEGIYAFADVPRAARLERGEVERLARLGLRRFYLGVETGSERLLKQMRKPHAPRQVREAVARLHAGGVAAGIILLVGAGGRRFAAEHRAETARLIGSLDLGASDFVFLSPLDASASASAEVAGDEPLGERELASEVRQLRQALQAAAGRRLRIADYMLESFVY